MRVEAMKKRSSTGGKRAKARPRKVLKLKGRNAPVASGPVPILLRIGRSLWKFTMGRLQIADMDRFAINHLIAEERKSANRRPVAQERHSEDRPVPECPLAK